VLIALAMSLEGCQPDCFGRSSFEARFARASG
jgi:hypothetical protein